MDNIETITFRITHCRVFQQPSGPIYISEFGSDGFVQWEGDMCPFYPTMRLERGLDSIHNLTWILPSVQVELGEMPVLGRFLSSYSL